MARPRWTRLPSARSWRCVGLGLGLIGVLGAWGVAAAGPAGPQARGTPGPVVACHIDYGGETRTLTAAPSAQPLTEPAHEVGSYFLVRVVNTLGQRPLGALTVTVWAAHDDGPVPIHEARYAPPHPSLRPRPSATPTGFTGLQRVYEPVRDGELTYWCDRPTRATITKAATVHASAHAPSAKTASGPSTSAPMGTPAAPGAPAHPNGFSAHPDTLRLVMVGDVMLDDGPGRLIEGDQDPLDRFDALLRQADHTLGNLELPVATVGRPMDRKIFNFRAHPRVMNVLRGRFHTLSVANNHAGDYGQAAFLETLQHLDAAGIGWTGGGRNLEEAHRPLWIQHNGIRVAVLAANGFKPRAFEAGPNWPGVAWMDDERLVNGVRAARAAGANVVIPYLHWGWERERQPNASQRALAQRLIDAGADVVVGGHPHVTQGVETHRGKLIVYSLGNFVFDSFDDVPGGTTGWLLRLTLDRHGLVAWDTVTAEMDRDGKPHPVPGAVSPCGERIGHRSGATAQRMGVRDCVNAP